MPKKTEDKAVKPYDPYEDRVIVNIPPPTEAEDGKGFPVSINEYHAIIQYGVDVEVPRFVADAVMYRKMGINDKRKNEAKRDARTAKK